MAGCLYNLLMVFRKLSSKDAAAFRRFNENRRSSQKEDSEDFSGFADFWDKALSFFLRHGIADGAFENEELKAFLFAFDLRSFSNNFALDNSFLFDAEAGRYAHQPRFERILNSPFLGEGQDHQYVYAGEALVGDSDVLLALLRRLVWAYRDFPFFFSALLPSLSAAGNTLQWAKIELPEALSYYVNPSVNRTEEEADSNEKNLVVGVPLAVPFRLEEALEEIVTLIGVRDEEGRFVIDENATCSARLLRLSKARLFAYHQHLDLFETCELSATFENLTFRYFAMVPSATAHRPLSLVQQKTDSSPEDHVLCDITTFIPVVYEDSSRFVQTDDTDTALFLRRINVALSFRSSYESGFISAASGQPLGDYRSRLKRVPLGCYWLRLKRERRFDFDVGAQEEKSYGDVWMVALNVAFDTQSNIACVEVTSLAAGFPLSQYLDCVSRNELSLFVCGDEISLFEFLQTRYHLSKSGRNKTFINAFVDRSEVPENVLAAILLGETYNQTAEGLGNVVDSRVIGQIQKPHGQSIYNYGVVYMGASVIFLTSDDLSIKLRSRFAKEAVSLFYIELAVLEEAAISYAIQTTTSILSNIEKFAGPSGFKAYSQMLNQYAKTASFWDVQLNYPSSQQSVEDIRQHFQIPQLQGRYRRVQRTFIEIFQERQDFSDRKENNVLAAIGACLAIMDIASLIVAAITGESWFYWVAPSSGPALLVVLLVWKRGSEHLFYKRKNNGKKR